ncbi:sarcoplasmic/endoplasmic reticulum calcium ATPase regulator DWORF isoform X1 [Lathamus discolor]|uniref:sarcoplasmic/endoplasmic reticulum calcium ATPase regulator DWORF isoform X1 n=1 Tax=Lathamus discolor TaxID=678569 RepID=UPI0032B72952
MKSWYFFPPGALEFNFGLIPFLQAVRYNSSKEELISIAIVREETILKKAQVSLSHLVVPILLAVGWIVGCALMVYIVFS